MPQIIGDYPVLVSGTNVGHVTVALDGLMTVFDCTCAYPSNDILRLAAVCSSTYVPLGVMMPEDGKTHKLHLKKSYSKNALMSLGYGDTTTFHLIHKGDVFTAPDNAELQVPDNAEPEGLDNPEPEAPDDTQPEGPYKSETSFVGDDNTFSEQHSEETSSPEVMAAHEMADDTTVVVYNDFPEPTDYNYPFVPEAPAFAPAPSPEPAPAPEPVMDEAPINVSQPDMDNVPIPQATAEECPGGSSPAETATPEKGDILWQLKTFLKDTSSLPSDDVEESNVAAAHESAAPTTGSTGGWVPIAHPGNLFADPDVREASAGVYGALTQEQDGLVLLAVPVAQDEPFPMMPVFCFGSSGQIGGREYIIFKIKNGNLTL